MRRCFYWAAFCASITLLGQVAAYAATTVALSPGDAFPTQKVTVSGSGFGDLEAVDVYIDTTDTLLLVTSSTGTISANLNIPAAETPGPHYITAIGRHTGDAAQGTFTVTTPFAEFGFGGARRGWNPYENTLDTSNVSSLGLLWTGSADSGGNTATVVNGSVYVGTLAGIQALSATTGQVLWSKETGAAFYASPTVSASVVYAAGGNSVMYALKASDGFQLWSTTLGGEVLASAVVANGLVYVGCGDGKVYALSASTGTVKWTYTTGDFIDSSPAVVDGALYIGSEDDNVYALNAATGAELWAYKTGGAVESTPAAVNGVIYVGSDDAKFYAIRANGSPSSSTPPGTLLWSVTTGADIYQDPAVAYGAVYIGSLDGNMYAFDARTGAELWVFAPDSYPRPGVVANGVLYFTSNGGLLYALNAATGAVLWSAQPGGMYFGSPSVADGVVYASVFEGSTYAFAPLADTNVLRAHRRAPSPSSLHPDQSLRVDEQRVR